MPMSKDKRGDLRLIAVAIAVMAVLVIGEVIVYTSDYTDYSADASMDGGAVSYSISGHGSKNYSVVVSDNGSYGPIERLYIYQDDSYRTNYEKVTVAVGARELDMGYYVEQMAPTLRYRGIQDVTVLDAEGLKEALESDIASGGCSGAGLVMISGAFPDTVYKGSADDVVMTWISAGGSLYWVGNLIGSCYATQDSLVPVDGYQELFFGSECLNDSGGKAYGEVQSNDYCSLLSLKNNQVRYAVDCSKIDGRSALAVGFQSEEGYSSAALVSYGSGMVAVIAGDYSNMQREDLAQIIASGIGPESHVIGTATGTVSGNASGTIAVTPASGECRAFIYLGGYYPVYCRLVQL